MNRRDLHPVSNGDNYIYPLNYRGNYEFLCIVCEVVEMRSYPNDFFLIKSYKFTAKLGYIGTNDRV